MGRCFSFQGESFSFHAQGFALFGTLVGSFTIAVGVGPRTAPDIAYPIGIVIVLVCGVFVAMRARSGEARQH